MGEGAHGSDEMAPHISPTVPPLEDGDLLSEILLRLPPLPSSLPRVSLVSKQWGHLAASAAFRRRFCTHHRKPPVLGLFENYAGELLFTPVLDPPDRIPRERFSLRPSDWAEKFTNFDVHGCRHGRILIVSSLWRWLIMFHPASGDRHLVPIPQDFFRYVFMANGAVLCAASGYGDQGHVHGDCHSSPFKVVMVSTARKQAVARVYSSETGLWGDLITMPEPCTATVSRIPCTLIGSTLYWWLNGSEDSILKFDLDSQRLAFIKRPPFQGIQSRRIRIIRAEDGGVGLAVLSYPSFQMWGRRVDSDGVTAWVLHSTVSMDKILGLPSEIEAGRAAITGYAVDADEIFISVEYHFFIVQLESMQSKKLCGSFLENSYHPFTNLYTDGPSMLQLPVLANNVQSDDGAANDGEHSLIAPAT